MGALKIIHGQIDRKRLDIPDSIGNLIRDISPEWIEANAEVPCAVYEPSEERKVDKIITLTHGKGVKAGRDKWDAVARARHNRLVHHLFCKCLC